MIGAALSLFSATPPTSSNSSWNGRVLKADPPPASRIIVRNLSYSIGEANLIKLFSVFGQVIEVKLATNEKTRRSKGYAFIQYSSQDDAMLAIEQMDHTMIGDRVVYAEIAKPSNRGLGYPKSSGPPLQQNSDADATTDH